jgi:hypothetical protein
MASLDPEPGPLEERDPAGAVKDDRVVVPAADPGLDAARQLAPAEPAGEAIQSGVGGERGCRDGAD